MRAKTRIGLVSVLALAAAVLLARGANAVGELTNGGCVDDTSFGADVCAQMADGLGGPLSVAVSPDGRSVYVATNTDDAIVRFNRSASGALTPAGCIEDNDSPSSGCGQAVNGLGGAISVAVSPDGRSVYVAANNDDAIVRFNRSATGALTPAGCVDDNDTGPDGCAQSVNGLDQPDGLTVSADGDSVYAVSHNDHAIVRFNRAVTGALTSGGCIDDNDSGPDVCAQSVNGLATASSVAVSPDGQSVYVSSLSDSAIVRFNRSSAGALTPAGCVDDNDSGSDACAQSVNALAGAQSVAISADGKSVYVATDSDRALVRFDRSTTGALSSGGCIDDNDFGPDVCARSVNGLGVPRSVAVSPDGGSVYAAALFDDAVVRFNRSATGALTSGGCIDDNDTGNDVCAQSVNGLYGASAVTVSPDDRSVYVTGGFDNSVVRFNRAA